TTHATAPPAPFLPEISLAASSCCTVQNQSSSPESFVVYSTSSGATYPLLLVERENLIRVSLGSLRYWIHIAANASSYRSQELRNPRSELAMRSISCRSASTDSAVDAAIAPYPRIRSGRESSKVTHIWDASDAKMRRRFFFEGLRWYLCTRRALRA